jgi:drug/metabolite transporter (DMT)-like permease
MWEELFRDGTTAQITLMLLFVVVMGFALMTPLVWVFGKIIALREKPDRRALWTAAAAYAGAAFIFIFSGGDFISPWLGAFVPMPGAVLTYFWLRHIYRKGWVDDENVPEGLKLENSDWRVGLGAVVTVIVAAAIKVAFIR